MKQLCEIVVGKDYSLEVALTHLLSVLEFI